MITISAGVFTAVDIIDAVAEGAVRSKGTWVEFGRQVVLRMNYPGVARFTVAVGKDTYMGILRKYKTKARITLKAQALCLMDAKLYYGESLIWTAVKNTNLSINSLYEAIDHTISEIISVKSDIDGAIERIEEIDVCAVDEKNPGLRKSLLELL